MPLRLGLLDGWFEDRWSFLFGSPRSDEINGGPGRDVIFAGLGNDVVDGQAGNDIVFGGFGSDEIHGGIGNDFLAGGPGDDMLVGGSGDDIVHGGNGNDQLLFDPSNAEEGHDKIRGFELGKDTIVLNAADVVRADTSILAASGDPDSLDLTDFDAAASWDVVASKDGDVTVVHPGGKIELDGIAFSEATDSFAELLPALDLVGAIVGDDTDEMLVGDDDDNLIDGQGGNDVLSGGAGDDVLIGGPGDDDYLGQSGDDLLIGGDGVDRFFFNPANPDEGADAIDNFTLGEDKIVLNVADILAADPDLVAASGDPTVLEPSDFDADPDWNVVASADGDVTVVHPNGTIELNGVAFGAATDSFAELLPALELQ